MKKKNFFAQYKQFTFFLILAVVIILIAVFAPVVSGGVDPLKGSLDEIVAKLDMADVRRAVHTGACNLYHAACHNMLHEQSREVLMELYKTSVFTIQAEYFLKTGNYLRRKAELFPKLNGLDREILYIAIEMKQKSGKVKGSFDELSEKLIVWSSGLIRQYQGEK